MDHRWGGIISRIFPGDSLISIKRFSKGVINNTYDVKLKKRNVVLRVYPTDLWKVEKEEYLYGLIRNKTDVPVPEVIAKGNDYIVLSRIIGKSISVDNKLLVEKAGELLAKLHSIKFPYYGWIIKSKINPKFEKWGDFVLYDLNLKLGKMPFKHNELKDRVKKIIASNKYLLDVETEPCLLHKDYHSSHILASGGKINGIIDLEWAMAGHNELDLVKSCMWMFDKKPEMEKLFFKGYKKYGNISKEFKNRRKLYKIITSLSSLSFSYECRNKKWCIYNFDKLKGELDEYN
ncbi:MAG: aminoglycoside phosphotransferase family protein [Nanoarchaeota archaeon]|nr:aminoglycoside phosphotransferase family protein [Nanoarchaeota archaeon]MBU1004941.1 aminoglycoside phosphotransferase family protein [Nanoarchaeota archaeon]MBU1945613.1 aminoglycoside phosphotransferase family protein [Nanoarchaeota archaeon]